MLSLNEDHFKPHPCQRLEIDSEAVHTVGPQIHKPGAHEGGEKEQHDMQASQAGRQALHPLASQLMGTALKEAPLLC